LSFYARLASRGLVLSSVWPAADSPKVVDFAERMRSGEWEKRGPTSITVDHRSCGVIVGRHRCAAVSVAQISLPIIMLVANFGLGQHGL
jgi:hypothetical protein